MISFTVRIPMSALRPRHEKQAEIIDLTYDHPYEDREAVMPFLGSLYIEYDVEDVDVDYDSMDKQERYAYPHLNPGPTAWAMKNPRLVCDPS